MIICLAWGSLVWKPGELKIKGGWKNDGPNLAVEYLRQSKDGRLTLVINEGGMKLPVLWAEMDFQNCDEAIENLRVREGNIKREHVGFWQSKDKTPFEIPELDTWARSKGAETILWTALPPKFDGDINRKPTLEEVIIYLQMVDENIKFLTEEYVRKTPTQIRTPFRSELEHMFGWSSISQENDS